MLKRRPTESKLQLSKPLTAQPVRLLKQADGLLYLFHSGRASDKAVSLWMANIPLPDSRLFLGKAGSRNSLHYRLRCHVEGEKASTIGSISSRPNSIPKESTALEKSE